MKNPKIKKNIDKSKWIWMPHAGHFILGDRCRFHLTTRVGKYIVSTVGELWNDETIRRIHAEIWDKKWYQENQFKRGDEFASAYFKKFGYEDLHFEGWKYETMVFPARKQKEKDAQCCPYEVADFSKSFEDEWYKTAIKAYKGHLRLCKKYSKLD